MGQAPRREGRQPSGPKRPRGSADDLRELNERFALLARATTDALWDWDLEKNRLWWNDAFEDRFGKRAGPDTESSAWWLERIHPADREQTAKSLQAAIDGDADAWSAEYRFRRLDGSYAVVCDRATVVRDSQGKARRMAGAISDITETRVAEERLREAQALLQTFHENAPNPMGIVELLDNDILHVHANPAMCRLMGLEPGRATGKRASRIGTPETIIRWWVDHLRQCQLSGGQVRFKYCHTRVGETRWFSVAMSEILPHASSGRPRFCYSTEDITQYLSLSQEKEEALAVLDAMMASAPVGFAVFDTEYRYRLVNRHLADLNGVPVSEHLGRTPFDVVPSVAAQGRILFDGVMESGAPVIDHELSGETQAAPGQLRYWTETWYPVRAGDGAMLGVAAVISEITERKRVEADLRLSRERLDLAQRSASIGTFDWDLRSNRIVWTEQLEAIYGLAPGEFQGTREHWANCLHPEDLPTVERYLERVIERRSRFDDRYRIVRPGGNVRWIRGIGKVLTDTSGEAARMLGVNIDVTEQVEVEERLRETENIFLRLASSNVIGIFIFDGAGRFYYANDAFLEMVGYTHADLKAGALRFDQMTPAEYQHLDDRARGELIASGGCGPFEMELVRKDGSKVSVLLGAAMLEPASTPPQRSIGISVDLTERKTLERKLLERQKLESIGLLAGGIAHDFNNLLVGILGNASLAESILPAGHEAAGFLRDIAHAAERAATLTRQMLAYSGRGRFVLEPIDLSVLAAEIVGLVRRSIPGRIEVRLELQPGLQPIEGDSSQMQQIIMNLVLNAAEAIGDAAGVVGIRTGFRQVDPDWIRRELEGADLQPGDYVFLEVSDNGCGMDESTKARIFDPFFTTKFTGRGLGLAAVAGIVRGHNGTIRVTSQPGAGSSFLVLVPAATRPNPAVRPAATLPETRGSGTILVVDDQLMVRQMVKVALESRGYTVLLAGTGSEAMQIFEKEAAGIALILLDFSMPGMGGDEVVPKLRQIRSDAKIVITSGYGESEIRRIFESTGLDGFIQKPYTAKRLCQIIAAALGTG